MKKLLFLLFLIPLLGVSQIADTSQTGKIYKKVEIAREVCIIDTMISLTYSISTYFIYEGDTILLKKEKRQPVVDIRAVSYLKNAFYTNLQLQAVRKYIKYDFKNE